MAKNEKLRISPGRLVYGKAALRPKRLIPGFALILAGAFVLAIVYGLFYGYPTRRLWSFGMALITTGVYVLWQRW